MTEALGADLTDKVAVVTGASSGLGRHFASVLARSGATVIATGRRADALDETVAAIRAEGNRAHAVIMDVTDPTSVRSAFAEARDHAGDVPNLLINNAGVALTQAAMEVTPGDWGRVIDTNLSGAFSVAQEAAHGMQAARGGAIINISSILGVRVAGKVAAYAASKAAVVHLTKALALEWARHGIRVNALAPGYIETDLNRAFFESEAGQRLIQRIPQRRLGRLEDLDGPLLLLCSETSRYMTGSVITVDGGHLVSSL